MWHTCPFSDAKAVLIGPHADIPVLQGLSRLHFLIFDMKPVNSVDAMGLHLLEDLVFDTKKRGIQLLLANPCKNVSRGRVKLLSSSPPEPSSHLPLPHPRRSLTPWTTSACPT